MAQNNPSEQQHVVLLTLSPNFCCISGQRILLPVLQPGQWGGSSRGGCTWGWSGEGPQAGGDSLRAELTCPCHSSVPPAHPLHHLPALGQQHWQQSSLDSHPRNFLIRPQALPCRAPNTALHFMRLLNSTVLPTAMTGVMLMLCGTIGTATLKE